MNLSAYLEGQRKRVDHFLENHFRETPPHFAKLFESIRYSLLAGGKRIRPILALAAYDAVISSSQRSDHSDEAILRISAALEMIHTYSLIHDDLPAMDNDDLRRGRQTNHKVYGEALAILAGDSLLTEAFQVIAGASGVSSQVLLEIIHDIAEASGARGMAGGQALDLESEGRKITPEELKVLHRHKTGCLIRVSLTSGAKLAGARSEQLEAIRQYGEKIGLTFQIADDILDVEGGAQEMGKNTGGDAKKEKSTYPSLLGLEKSKQLAQSLTSEAIDLLTPFDERAEPLREIAKFIVMRRK